VWTENILLIRAMRDSNVPKFLEHDLPLFKGIVADLFPGVDVPFVDYGKLQAAIEDQLELAGLQKVPALITKIIQTHETQLVRHGMMLVGEAGSGKTVNTMVLSKALTQLKKDGVVDKDGFFQIVQRYTLNPKSVTMGELYGEFNLVTQEWADGLVATLVRAAVADTTPNRKWMMFDGPVDALWIENMNTVLDDNKMLCLANGERIKLPPTVHMMFEVRDLAVASPATVSRCGMVFMEPVHVGVLPLVHSWAAGEIADYLPEHMARLVDTISVQVPAVLSYLRANCREIIPSQDMNLVQVCLNAVCLMSLLLELEDRVLHASRMHRSHVLFFLCSRSCICFRRCSLRRTVSAARTARLHLPALPFRRCENAGRRCTAPSTLHSPSTHTL
jgi:dynein heavy chain, axonemal